MFCLTLEPNHYKFISSLGYIPVGLGAKDYNEKWFSDKSGESISKKNTNYGEYTFHYWIWKNHLNKLGNDWLGFCQYRKFFSLEQYQNDNININTLTNKVLKEIPAEYDKFESILVEPMFTNRMKLMKFLKKGLGVILKKPSLIVNKSKRNINFHFDLMHGENNLKKAIDLLDDKNREDFREFVNNKVSFNPHNMFICRSKDILKNYYDDVFPWLEKCEDIFGFENLKGFGKIRIYGFLAERFMSYWFQKNTKHTTLPIIFYDIRNDLNNL